MYRASRRPDYPKRKYELLSIFIELVLKPQMDLWNAYVNAVPRETKFPAEYLPMVNAAYAPPTEDVTDDDSGHSSAEEEGEY